MFSMPFWYSRIVDFFNIQNNILLAGNPRVSVVDRYLLDTIVSTKRSDIQQIQVDALFAQSQQRWVFDNLTTRTFSIWINPSTRVLLPTYQHRGLRQCSNFKWRLCSRSRNHRDSIVCTKFSIWISASI